MDTTDTDMTHDPEVDRPSGSSPDATIEGLLVSLSELDPVDSVDVSTRIADLLGTALDEESL